MTDAWATSVNPRAAADHDHCAGAASGRWRSTAPYLLNLVGSTHRAATAIRNPLRSPVGRRRVGKRFRASHRGFESRILRSLTRRNAAFPLSDPGSRGEALSQFSSQLRPILSAFVDVSERRRTAVDAPTPGFAVAHSAKRAPSDNDPASLRGTVGAPHPWSTPTRPAYSLEMTAAAHTWVQAPPSRRRR